jgi:IS5 family transposase
MKKTCKVLDPKLVAFSDHTRRAKRRHIGICYARFKKDRKPLYRDLIRVTEWVRDAALAVASLDLLVNAKEGEALAKLSLELKRSAALTDRVLDQTRRRVLLGESVPASEKIVSIFEDHTDILVKDRRATLYGHKICLAGGPSSLILDCVICDGNPPDSSLVEEMIDRQTKILGRVPRQVVFDGGFASRANLEAVKSKGVTDVAFSKRRGIAVSDMVKSSWVYRRLKHFRAGIEGNISFLKRVFGLSRCTWEGSASFKSYVWSSIVSFNLLVIARHLLS